MNKVNGQKRRFRRNNERISSAVFLLPSLVGVSVFYIIPFGIIIYYSVISNPIQRNFVYLNNFKAVLLNDAFQTAAVNTSKFSVAAVPLAVVLALMLAVLLEGQIPGKSLFRTFFLSPMMVPVASVVLIWQVIFSADGVLNGYLAIFGVEAIDWLKSDKSRLVIIILFLWKNLGYNMILFMSSLNQIPEELIEYASLEGAGTIYRFVRIKLRYISPTILFVTILSLINSFKVFREIYLLTGDYPYGDLYMLQHFMNNTFTTLDYQKLSAAAIIMAIVMIAIIAILFMVEYRFGKDVEG